MAYMVKQIQPAGPVLADRIIANDGLGEAMEKARVIVKRLGYRLAKTEGDEMVFTQRDSGVPIRVKVEEMPRHPLVQILLPDEAEQAAPVVVLPRRFVVKNRATGQVDWFAIPCDIKTIVREAAANLGYAGNPRSHGSDAEFSMTFRRGRKAMTFDIVKRAAGDEE